MTDKVYNILKYVALIAVPALVAFLATFGEIWGIAMMPQITATIGALGTMLGTLLCISSERYQKNLQNKQNQQNQQEEDEAR